MDARDTDGGRLAVAPAPTLCHPRHRWYCSSVTRVLVKTKTNPQHHPGAPHFVGSVPPMMRNRPMSGTATQSGRLLCLFCCLFFVFFFLLCLCCCCFVFFLC